MVALSTHTLIRFGIWSSETYFGRVNVVPPIHELDTHMVHMVRSRVRQNQRLGVLATKQDGTLLSVPAENHNQQLVLRWCSIAASYDTLDVLKKRFGVISANTASTKLPRLLVIASTSFSSFFFSLSLKCLLYCFSPTRLSCSDSILVFVPMLRIRKGNSSTDSESSSVSPLPRRQLLVARS